MLSHVTQLKQVRKFYKILANHPLIHRRNIVRHHQPRHRNMLVSVIMISMMRITTTATHRAIIHREARINRLKFSRFHHHDKCLFEQRQEQDL